MDEKKWIIKEMKKAKKKGINIRIDGEPYNFESKQKTKKVLESNIYMEDFILNSNGKLIEISFDKIKNN